MLNKVSLVGRLTRDPELRFTQSGKAVASFTLAVDRGFKNAQGEREADFIPIVVWGKPAENCNTYLAKGRLVAVSGRIQVRKYQAQDGTNRIVTEVVSEEVHFLEWGSKDGNDKPKSDNRNASKPSNDDSNYPEGFYPVGDDDDDDSLPF